jgi:hypothetical protein
VSRHNVRVQPSGSLGSVTPPESISQTVEIESVQSCKEKKYDPACKQNNKHSNYMLKNDALFCGVVLISALQVLCLVCFIVKLSSPAILENLV